MDWMDHLKEKPSDIRLVTVEYAQPISLASDDYLASPNYLSMNGYVEGVLLYESDAIVVVAKSITVKQGQITGDGIVAIPRQCIQKILITNGSLP